MRFDCDRWKRARAARSEARRQWHRWFAWYPVRVEDEQFPHYVWLEWVKARVEGWDSPFTREWGYRACG